jgi:hypothetical protein
MNFAAWQEYIYSCHAFFKGIISGLQTFCNKFLFTFIDFEYYFPLFNHLKKVK